MCISSARRSHVYYCHCKIVSGFHNDEQNLFTILRKNLYPEHVLDSHVYSTVTHESSRHTIFKRCRTARDGLGTISRSPTTGIFQVFHNQGCANQYRIQTLREGGVGGGGGSNSDYQQFSLKIRAPRGPSQDPPLQTLQRIL